MPLDCSFPLSDPAGINGEKRRGFLICPVREADEARRRSIEQWMISKKRRQNIYCPLKHTDQSDQHGIKICTANRLALTEAEDLFIWFDQNSMGSHFDIGMALMAEESRFPPLRSFLVVNRKEFGQAEPSIVRALVYFLDKRLRRRAKCAEDGAIVDFALSLAENTYGHTTHTFTTFSRTSPWDLIRLGMLFYEIQFLQKRVLTPPNTVLPTAHKSFQNVLLRMAELTQGGPRSL